MENIETEIMLDFMILTLTVGVLCVLIMNLIKEKFDLLLSKINSLEKKINDGKDKPE